MCTAVVLFRPGHDWPVLLGANRDEMVARPWDRPGAYWPDHPGVVAGRDRSGGGTWMGMNAAGVVAAVLNRPGSLGPAPGKRSRGALPLLALGHDTAADAAAALADIPAGEYRSFNMIVADSRSVVFVRGLDGERAEPIPLPAGLHMVTAHDPNDEASPRTARHLPRFRAAAVPAPAIGDWRAWTALLADRGGPQGSEINVPERHGFATVSSALVGLPACGRPVWLFAAGPPDAAPFVPVQLAAREGV
ncbi:NRDE family protein [Limobrevibacterium gyesilva]|uniref:NRDE family protein n=1 Tax=Limobrevibacterium gyesilva TaxID=2991712 RepID=A0AA42CD66_9PROT|nr:NRDE family protein [Limobrevibacterium gyesilva]MCW3474468.1 NRDE family protein [Limobrevibacterium gyesilva]